MQPILRLLAIAALGLTAGCATVSPPLVPVVARTAETLAPGQVRIQLGGGGGAAAFGADGEGGGGGVGRVSVGIALKHELGVSAAVIAGDFKNNTTGKWLDDLYASGELEYQYQFHKHIALLINAGGGASPLGAFAGVGAGVVGSARFDQIEPYVAVLIGGSVPIDAQVIIDSDDSLLDKPRSTGIVSFATGASFHLSPALALLIEGGGNFLFDGKDNNGGGGYGLAMLETRF